MAFKLPKFPIWNKLISSFDNHSTGFSARKLSAFVGILVSIYITAVELHQEAQLHALYAWLLFILLCLSVITAEQIIKLKNNNLASNTPPTPETTGV
jgi:hypothetical protein